jgi:hypothetical protein
VKHIDEKRGKSITENLIATRRLLKNLNSIKHRTIADFLKVPDFDPDEILDQTERVLALMRSEEIMRTDPYIESGFSPSENRLSNAIAAIIDPFGRHYQGTLGLRALLASAEFLSTAAQREAIRRVQETLRGNSLSTKVHREHAFESGRIDLRVVGPGFEILVENKLRGGSEVVLGGRLQTLRYETLIEKAIKQGCDVVAVYLTPEGKRPSSRHFIAVSTGHFSRCLLDELAEPPDGGDQKQLDSWAMMRAFAMTYDLFNSWRPQ